MQLSQRARRLTESATLKVTRRVKELRAAGKRVIDFGAGEPDFDSPAVAVEAAIQALRSGFTRYTVSAGIPDLREALARRYAELYGAPWGLSQTLIAVGAKAVIFEIIMALADEEGEVVLPSPEWVSFSPQIELAGGKPVPVETLESDDFQIRAAPVLAALNDNTRLVLVNSPCNPTGGILPAEELRQIVEACARRSIPVLCDETYERLVYDGRSFPSGASLAAEYPETVLVAGSFSKTYAMTGWRIGYALGPNAILGKASAIQGHVTSNPTSFAMRGALAALEGAEESVREMVAAFEDRRNYLVKRLRQLPGVSCSSPAGAFYTFPNVSGAFRPGEGSVAFAERMLEEAGVAVVPGIAFGSDEHVRISFACSRETLEEGLDAMARALAPAAS